MSELYTSFADIFKTYFIRPRHTGLAVDLFHGSVFCAASCISGPKRTPPEMDVGHIFSTQPNPTH